MGIVLSSIPAFAEPANESAKTWTIESVLQLHSLASSGNAMFGPAFFYQVGESQQIGLKSLLSIGSSGAYQATLAYRYLFSREKSRLFGEIGAAYNIINFSTSIGSAGFALGFLHNLTDDLSIGGNAGFEFFGRNGPVSGYMNIGDSVRFTPKASLLVSIDF